MSIFISMNFMSALFFSLEKINIAEWGVRVKNVKSAKKALRPFLLSSLEMASYSETHIKIIEGCYQFCISSRLPFFLKKSCNLYKCSDLQTGIVYLKWFIDKRTNQWSVIYTITFFISNLQLSLCVTLLNTSKRKNTNTNFI